MSSIPFAIPRGYLEPKAKACLAGVHPKLKRFFKAWDGASGALLLGPTGVGKSLVVAWLGARLNASKRSEKFVRWVRADELSTILQDKGGFDDVRLLKSCPVLIIDEMGWECWPETIQQVIGTRAERRIPTLVTSGQTFAGFTERYGDAVVRKITTIGKGGRVDCWQS